MSQVEDVFDLDIRLSVSADARPMAGLVPGPQADDTDDDWTCVTCNGTCVDDCTLSVTCFDTCARVDNTACGVTCDINTCGVECITVTCPADTQTCNQGDEDCGGLPFTFGDCEDQSDGCGDPGPGGTADCDPPD